MKDDQALRVHERLAACPELRPVAFGEGRRFALWDLASLAEGYVSGDVVECAYHMAKFNIRTGKVLSPPAYRDLSCYDVKVEDGVVYVDG